MVLFALIVSCGQDDKADKLKEKESGRSQAAGQSPQISKEKEYVDLGKSISTLNELRQGDVFEITNTRRNETHKLVIRRVQETLPGLLSISANIETKDTGLATLILRDKERLLGTLHFYKENTRFRIAFDSAASRHYLTELSPEELDELEGGSPLDPSKDQK